VQLALAWIAAKQFQMRRQRFPAGCHAVLFS
jgi:hypothetical protein